MKNHPTGTLYIIAAPSGAGKTSLVKALLAVESNLKVSISHTTRPKRSSEQDGVDYYFIDQAKFEKKITHNIFLEYARVFTHYYGTSKEWVNDQLMSGVDVILEIDWQGAQQIRKQMPHCVSIFILPPALETLRERLQARNQDDDQVIAQRLAAASKEVSHYAEFDYLVVNDDFAHALADLQTIFRAERLRQVRQSSRYHALLEDLLGNQ